MLPRLPCDGPAPAALSPAVKGLPIRSFGVWRLLFDVVVSASHARSDARFASIFSARFSAILVEKT